MQKRISPRLWGVLVLFAAVTSTSLAAVEPRLVLSFVDDPAQVSITDGQGKALKVDEGLVIAPGATIRTKDSAVELRLDPNGSILRLARGTVFRVRALQDLQGSPSSDFSVLSGKIRMVAAKLVGTKGAYNVFTPVSQAGVRGTDFAVEANADEGDWICVKEGAVEFAILRKDGKKEKAIVVQANEFANVKAPDFRPKKATAADLADKFEGLDFVKVKEADVPGHGGN